MLKPVYLDYMATTPIDSRVAEKMQFYLTDNCAFGNPESQHFYGYQAKAAIENSRAQVAALIKCDPKNIIWTSGATEANNLAIIGAAQFYRHQGKHIITCKTEHKSVLDTCRYLETQGFSITYLTPKTDGLIELGALEQSLRPDTILISIMHVNNEIGVIQNIEAIGELASERGVLFHTDAAQSIGKISIDMRKLKVDLMSFSSHKIYGPKGIGVLYIRQQPKLRLVPQIYGGEQERGYRSGTLAVHQIVGMGEALQIAGLEMIDENKRLLILLERLWYGIKDLGDIYINGSLINRIAGNLNISFSNINGELLLAALKNLALSAASTCTRGQSSYVLKAIGVKNNLIANTLRISIGRFTTEADIDFAIKHIREVVVKLRELVPLY